MIYVLVAVRKNIKNVVRNTTCAHEPPIKFLKKLGVNMLKNFIISSSFLMSLLIVNPAFAKEELIFAIDVIRHGDRTPTVEVPNSPYGWKEGLGQLTSKGMQQEYKNGRDFRKMYVNKYHLLPSQYAYNQISVRSSDFDRTIMSAEAVLSGLYPIGTGPLPNGYQPIPIHTIQKDQDSLLVPDYDKQRREDLLARYVYTNKDWQAKNTEFQSKFKQWSDISGFSINNLRDLIVLGDNLQIRKFNNVPLPATIGTDEANTIISLAEWAIVNSYKPYEIGVIISHELLSTIKNYFDQASLQKTPLKYVLFSAHDSTILGVMSALQVPVDKWPPYATDLKFTLFKDEDNYKVKIFYNNKPIKLPACGGTSCSLTQFTDLVKKIEIQAQALQNSKETGKQVSLETS
jgi:lysosomal acid phosphatase